MTQPRSTPRARLTAPPANEDAVQAAQRGHRSSRGGAGA